MKSQDNDTFQDESQTPRSRTSGLSRRKLLGMGSLAAAVLATPAPALAQNRRRSKKAEATNSTATDRYEAFTQPPAIASRKGEASTTMRVEANQFTYQKGNEIKTVEGRSFSGNVPGPTFLVDPGDKIKITLHNQLEGNPRCDGTPEDLLNKPSCFNSSNLHFHGLHVSPSSYGFPDPESPNYCDPKNKVLSSDDVLYRFDPGEDHNWCVWLPEFHAPGTHWYHAHQHGSTGLQVSNGMVGTILIREPNERLNIVAPTEDKVWVMQEIVGGTDDDIYPQAGLKPKGKPGARDPVRGVAGDFLINGKYQPTLEMKAGQTQRWRFVNANATPRGLLTLKLCRMDGSEFDNLAICPAGLQADMYLMAVDGISFYNKPPEPIGPSNKRSPKRTGWDFAPGNRADFLVNLKAGRYKLVKVVDRKAQGQSTRSQILAYINVQPANFNESIPATIPAPKDLYAAYPYLKPIEDDILINKGCPRKIEFSRQTPAGPRHYKINDQLFDPHCVNVTVKLNTAEEWELHTKSGAFHPFHIHVNPFQIVGDKIDPDGPDDPSNWRWWDTIAVPKGAEPIKIRNHFLDYYGVYVIHCHILIHEDQGMMFNINVEDDGTGIPPCYSLNRKGESKPGPEAQAVIAQGAKVCNVPDICPNPVEPECAS